MSNEMLGSQVKQLLSGVSDHGISHLNEVEEDLVQITLLLSEAIQTLGTNFLKLHSSLTSQRDLINKHVEEGIIVGESVDNFNQIHADIELHINEAVRSLQFQDLTSQLVTRTVQRSTGLRELLCTMNLVGNEIPKEGGNAEIMTVLKSVSKKLEIQSIELKTQLRKTVSQNSMGSGDIELF